MRRRTKRFLQTFRWAFLLRRPRRSSRRRQSPGLAPRSAAASAEARQACELSPTASRFDGSWPRRLPTGWPSGGWSIPHGTTCGQRPPGSCPTCGRARWACRIPSRQSHARGTAAPNGLASIRHGQTPGRCLLAWPDPTAAASPPPTANGRRRSGRRCKSGHASGRQRGSRHCRRTTPKH